MHGFEKILCSKPACLLFVYNAASCRLPLEHKREAPPLRRWANVKPESAAEPLLAARRLFFLLRDLVKIRVRSVYFVSLALCIQKCFVYHSECFTIKCFFIYKVFVYLLRITTAIQLPKAFNPTGYGPSTRFVGGGCARQFLTLLLGRQDFQSRETKRFRVCSYYEFRSK